MNLSQLESREKELSVKAKFIIARNEECELKGNPKSLREAVDKEMDAFTKEHEDLAWERKRWEASQAFGNKLGDNPAGIGTTKAISKTVSPLQIPVSEYKGLYEATMRRLPSYRIDCKQFDTTTKAAFAESSFTSGNLPPELLPALSLDLPYEPDRAFEHFKQLTSPEARAIEYLQHTGNANPAAPVAELGVKPDLGLQLTTVTTPFVKIAAIATISMEALADFRAFMAWVPHELFNAIVDAETNPVLNGSGSGPNMLGLLNTSGVLTRAIGSDTPIDCLRKGINDIRVGSAFAKADTILTHPTTWADLQLQKATTGAYLLNPSDPAALGDLTSVFGCKVVTNTYCPAGTAVVLDSNWVYAWTRQSLTLDINSYGVDADGTNMWTQNAVSYRAEERVALGVARPTAVNVVTGLPSS
jgi:Phage capsid family